MRKRSQLDNKTANQGTENMEIIFTIIDTATEFLRGYTGVCVGLAFLFYTCHWPQLKLTYQRKSAKDISIKPFFYTFGFEGYLLLRSLVMKDYPMVLNFAVAMIFTLMIIAAIHYYRKIYPRRQTSTA
ncbi:MAG: hypothetical protein ABIG32_02210 [Candidatus Uhrbacteria bacterium]|nr:hypothetical protein [Patescibacteria group bacterium]MBU1906937.1 hypothetical protein [Patescibacteria group bacterium]